MLVDKNSLQQHRGAIRENDHGPYVWGAFERLLTDCLVLRSTGSKATDAIHANLLGVSNRLSDLRTCAMKLDWMLGLRDHGELEPMTWMLFASSDVTSFLANVRSLFDHLARAMKLAAPQPGGIPSFSFNDLRKWALRDDLNQAAQIGDRMHELVIKCDWFDELRDLRDELLHHDAQAIVFPDAPGIAVQVYGRAKTLINEPALMASDNVAMFERLASATMARIYVLLEGSSTAISNSLMVEAQPAEGWSVHGGLRVLARWTDDHLAQLR